MTKALVTILLVSVLALVPQAVLGKSDNNQGKSDAAPGQNQNVVVGDVKNVTGNTIVVEDKKGNKEVKATVDKNTKVVGQNKKTLQVGNIKPKDMVAVISTDSAVSGNIKKVTKVYVKSATVSAQSKRHAIQGVIIAINGNTLTLAHQIQRSRTYTVLLTSSTVIKMKDSESSGSASLQVGQRVVVIGDLNENNVLVVKRIHVIPGKATGIFTKNPVATPTAIPTTTSTPSATPTVVSTPSATPTTTATTSANLSF